MAKTKHVRLVTPETGLTIYVVVTKRPNDPDDTVQILDVTDKKFRATSVDPYLDLTEDTTYKGLYTVSDSTVAWTDGFYEFKFYSQLAGAPAPATDDILEVTQTRIKITKDTIYSIFQTTDSRVLNQKLIDALGTIVTAPIEGTATGGTTSTLIDSTRSWEVDYWKNATYTYENAGTKYSGKITANTATQLTFSATAAAPVSGDDYTIHLIPNVTNIKWVNDTAQTGDDWTARFKALNDVSITGIMKTLGDIGVGDSVYVTLTNILADTTNIDTNVTAILADTASMDTNLGTVATDTTSIDGKLTGTNTKLDTIITNQGTIEDDIEAIAPATAPTVYNVEIAIADTQYTQVVASAKKVIMSFQEGTPGEDWRFAFVDTKVATPTHPYMIYDQSYQEPIELVNFSGTIYLAASTTGYIQLLVWS